VRGQDERQVAIFVDKVDELDEKRERERESHISEILAQEVVMRVYQRWECRVH
jgi:hypothetical protein